MHNLPTLQFPKDRLRSNSQEFIQTKRLRTGSISGRLRAASDLEELGLIDKSLKGVVKDSIISGDSKLPELLDKFMSTGESAEIVEYIRSDLSTRKDSIDLLEGLDFDFLTNIVTDNHLPGDDFDMPNWVDSARSAVPVPPTSTSHSAMGLHHSTHHTLNQHSTASLHHPQDYPPNAAATTTASATTTSSSSGVKVRKDSVLSLLEESFDRNRRASFDALMSGALLDDFAAHDVGELDLHGVFHDEGELSPGSPRAGEKYKKSIRITHPGDQATDLSTDNVDLSAYASHAAHLQQQNLEKKFNSASDPSIEAFRLKLEPSGKVPVVLSKPGMMRPDSQIKSPYLQSNIVSPYMTTSSQTNMGYPSSAMAMSGTGDLYYNGLGDLGMSSATASFVNELNQQQPSSQSSGTRLAGYIGAYSPEQRKLRIEKFLEKRSRRVWTRKVKYDVRKNFADSRLRIKGRFVKKEDEDIMRELMSI